MYDKWKFGPKYQFNFCQLKDYMHLQVLLKINEPNTVWPSATRHFNEEDSLKLNLNSINLEIEIFLNLAHLAGFSDQCFGSDPPEPLS